MRVSLMSKHLRPLQKGILICVLSSKIEKKELSICMILSTLLSNYLLRTKKDFLHHLFPLLVHMQILDMIDI